MSLTTTTDSQQQSQAHSIYQPLIKSVSLFFLLALLMALSAFTIHIDVLHIQNNVGENSWTELLQETYLFIASSLFAMVAIRQPQQRGFAILVSAFFGVMFIREMDSVLDQIVHGFWKYPAWLLASSAIGYAIMHRKTTVEPLMDYMKHNSFSLMLGAMVTLLVFSRIFGMGSLWQGIMQEHYVRGVKNLAEEGVELLAYSLILFTAAWYCIPNLKRTASKPSVK
ncbi:hypothetical protein C9J03_08535 [Photobacterium gaetbulicola]|uniref:Uncharacterized protein n=1 Tax=Photobacterium gaetbulicola Gung47 TaxID=658445 RepID=A0A0C5WT49_9GAMM|nr:hypothetical protein [Photobacterium gaetbulicola]AJR08209.1 hypothetical protein H744_2c1531 [Photobacterium gaetbulicola Gung47]PSU13086.1 hypothetical protein C9J03_08535 [Photobacterium gaetbulicola]